jgi:flagellar biosynthesis protein FlhF
VSLSPDPVAPRASRAVPPATAPRAVSGNGANGAPATTRPRETARPRETVASSTARPSATTPHARNRAAVERTLGRAGFSEDFARELTDTALAHTLALAPRIGLVPAVRAALAQRIPPARPLPATGCSIVVVGAGGSGKTTCCAALLGAYRTHSTLPARFATLVRPESETQLQLMMSPQMLEPQPADSPRAQRELRSAGSDGVVVIDTPRLSPSEPGGIRELGGLLGELQPDRIVVALPVTLGAVAAEQLLASLEPIGPAALALTHADETDQLGVGIELACRFSLAPELMVEHAPAGGWRLSRLDPAELAARVLR